MKLTTQTKYEILLALVIAVRATSFIFSKLVLEHMDTFNLLAIRFLLAFVLLMLVFFKRMRKLTRKELRAGIIVGVMFFLVMGSELTALKQADSSLVSLLENGSIIFVLLFEAILLRSLPSRKNVISALTAMAGVFCLTLQQGSLTGGVFFGLLAAVLYAAAIIVTARVSRGQVDSLRIGIVQVGTLGILALITTFLFETPHMPSGGGEWGMIILLAVICTGFGFTLQPMAQSHVSVSRAGLFCAISPAIAVLLGVLVLHERFSLLSAAGLFLIVGSIIFPCLRKSGREEG